jgi:hypothetical protein
MKKIYLAVAFILLATAATAQKQDTVVVNLGKTSKIVFTMGDPEDLEILKHYNFDELFEDVFKKLEEKDRKQIAGTDSLNDSTTVKNETVWTKEESSESDVDEDDDGNYDEDDNDDDDGDWDNNKHYHNIGSWQTFNFDLGTNNYLGNGKFPDDSNPYAVRPWGSWYVSLASVQRARLAKKFFLEWGIGVNWYNFKFEQDNVKMTKDESGVVFTPLTDGLDYTKSKLTASYVMTTLIPVLDFNDSHRKTRFWDGQKDSFRVGLGPYAAYRIGSHSKLVHEDDGKIKDKDYDSFYLNNFRYGLRFQAGYRSTDIFFNYDLNELFVSGKGPKLNAISFGVIF